MTPDIRQVDKTSLISWQSNKYSVPMAYQSAKVAVAAKAGQLLIHDIASGDRIAEHTISFEKGQIIKNTHHYRDMTQRVEALETVLEQQLGDSVSQRLCALLKASSPKIYKDQLLGAKQIIQAHMLQYGGINAELLERILTAPRLTATQLRDTLDAYPLLSLITRPPRVQPAPWRIMPTLMANQPARERVMSSIDSVAQKYRSLCLSGIAEHLEQLLGQAEANESSYLHFAEGLVEREMQQRNGNRIEQNKRRAGFSLHKSLEEFDYRFQTTISKREINGALDFGFIEQ